MTGANAHGRKSPASSGRRFEVTPAVLAVMAGLLVLSLIASGAALWTALANRSAGSSASSSSAATSAAGTNDCNAVVIAKKVLPSVVTIHLTSPSGQSGNGTGEFIDDQGHILTNDHVIAEAAKGAKMTVLRSNGVQSPATLVGRVPRLDLAVIRTTPDKDTVIDTADSSKLNVGQPTVALGAPLGLSGSVTCGIISALGRQMPLPDASGELSAFLSDVIQTDASINPGNSGGPLVDCDGRLIGVNTAIATVPTAEGAAGGGSVGLGFAIPVNTAMAVSKEILSSGSFTPGSFGISVVPLDVSSAAGSGGLYVNAVVANGAAARAGLKAGDVITEFDGQKARSFEDLVIATVRKRAGAVVKVSYTRDGQSHSTPVTLL